MISGHNKNIVLAFFPVMTELELMGHNPIPYFTQNLPIEMIETKYVALARVRKKYPKWYKVVSSFIDEVFSCRSRKKVIRSCGQ